MRLERHRLLPAVLFSAALHVTVLAWSGFLGFAPPNRGAQPKQPRDEVLFLEVMPAPAAEPPAPRVQTGPAAAPARPASSPSSPSSPLPAAVADEARPLATMDAPPAPAAEEWAFAARYTLKNSKGYRHLWGQQVRSLMGTAVEGADQGVVRFRVEISPEGTLIRLETLWSTSSVAVQRARRAIENMPPLPPTPTGKPLVFERTIAFSPFVSDSPPVYQDDCLPDPPSFRNRFAWEAGASPVAPTSQPTRMSSPPWHGKRVCANCPKSPSRPRRHTTGASWSSGDR